MGLYECASSKSVWRGYYYYEEKGHILSCDKIGEDIYKGKVQGTASDPYKVTIDIRHPRKSTCNCPFADGRRVVCKHMMALYFTVYPSEADRLLKEQEEYELEEELREQEEYEHIKEYVYSLSKAELRIELIDALSELEAEERYDRW